MATMEKQAGPAIGDVLPAMTIGEHLELERLRHHEQRLRLTIRAVSYTHLTLPTNREV